jgi:hypothetical protein
LSTAAGFSHDDDTEPGIPNDHELTESVILDIDPSPLPFIRGGAVEQSPSAILPSDADDGTTAVVSRTP